MRLVSTLRVGCWLAPLVANERAKCVSPFLPVQSLSTDKTLAVPLRGAIQKLGAQATRLNCRGSRRKTLILNRGDWCSHVFGTHSIKEKESFKQKSPTIEVWLWAYKKFCWLTFIFCIVDYNMCSFLYVYFRDQVSGIRTEWGFFITHLICLCGPKTSSCVGYYLSCPVSFGCCSCQSLDWQVALAGELKQINAEYKERNSNPGRWRRMHRNERMG